jgi:fimbrial chaperone protein
VNVFAWEQDAQGQIQLKPTDDMVVFPLMMTLQPKEERSVRVGAATTFGAVEKSYRLVIEELPPLVSTANQANVRMLTRMGVPIFLEPQFPKSSATLTDVAMGSAGLTFTLRNTANVFFIPDAVTVTAYDDRGAVLTEKSLESWYILAATSRVFEFDVPRPLCEQVRAFAISVDIGKTSLKSRLETPTSACGR